MDQIIKWKKGINILNRSFSVTYVAVFRCHLDMENNQEPPHLLSKW